MKRPPTKPCHDVAYGAKPDSSTRSLRSLARNDNPKDEVEQQTGHATRYERDQKQDPEPDRVDSEEFAQPPTDSTNNAVTKRTSQRTSTT